MQRPTSLVRLLRASSVAREDRSCFRGALRCFLDAWTRALKIGDRIEIFWVYRGSRRRGEVFAAPQAEWELPVNFWRLGECSWAVELGRGGL